MSTIYFGTNRQIVKRRGRTSFTSQFSEVELHDLRFGKAEVNLKQSSKTKRFKITPFDEKFDDKVDQFTKVGSEESFQQIQTLLSSETGKKSQSDVVHDVLIYIHGFNVDFEEALEAAAEMQERYALQPCHGKKRELLIFAFSWPSHGNALRYINDRRRAEVSGTAVARTIVKAVNFIRSINQKDRCERKIHLLAHSMGNYVLRHALQSILNGDLPEIAEAIPRHLPRMFDEVILAAADEDDDAFELESKLKRLPELATRVSVYFNRGDRALTGSDIVKMNPDRLGTDGPRNPRMVSNKITSVDCTHILPGITGLEHSYYKNLQGSQTSSAITRDISAILSGVASDDTDLLRRVFLPERNHYRIIE